MSRNVHGHVWILVFVVSDDDLRLGELECDDDAFEDHDEACHGPTDTEENRRDYPEHFIWTCCDENGLADGCEIGEHVPVVRKKARRT